MNHAILVVVDGGADFQAMERTLGREEYVLHWAASRSAAMDILQTREVGLILCKQGVPDMTDGEILSQAAQLHPDAYRIIIIERQDLAVTPGYTYTAGAHSILMKPWREDDLRALVQQGLGFYRMIQDNRRLQTLIRQQKTALESRNRELEAQVAECLAKLHQQKSLTTNLRNSLEQTLRDTVGLLTGLLEAHSPNLGIHSKRVAELVGHLARRLGYSGDALRDIEFAAYLHDIGKLAKSYHDGGSASHRPARRRGTLSHRYAEVGYTILSHVEGFRDIARVVRYQHERYDGHGYPEGLKGEEIPLESRIIAVIDAYDTAVFANPDPMQVSRDAGRRAVVEGRESKFDPKIVSELLEYLEVSGMQYHVDTEVELSARQIQEGMILSRDIKNVDDVLLLIKGTVLTRDMIDRIKAWSFIDPLLCSVFVRCTVGTVGEEAPPSTADSTPEDANREGETSPSAPSPEGACRQGVSPPPQGKEVSSEPDASPVDRAAALDQRRAAVRGLVVDDSSLVRKALAREFRRAGFECVTAGSGSEALSIIGHDHFDVALVDLAMPDMAGSVLIEYLRQHNPQLPCVIVTANATKQEVLSLRQKQNVKGFVVKPWDYERLMTVIRSAVRLDVRET